MGFNGKSLILVGAILFIFQIANFISIETITPELERAQVLAAIASLIIILIGFLFKQFQPIAGEKAVLKGENKFLFDRNMPDEVIDELAWGSEAILTSTAAAAILIHNDGESQWTLTHRDDFAKVLSSLLALEDINGEIFNIVSSEYKTWKNIYMIYEDQLKKKINTCNVPAEFIYKKDNLLGLPIIGDKQKNMIFDNSKIRKIIPDFDDFILLEDGLKRSIHWAKENPEKVYFKKNIKLKIANIIKSYKQSKEYTFYD